MKETLAEFLMGLEGYYQNGNRLHRPNGTSVAVYQGSRWVVTNPLQEEVALFGLYCNRCSPSMLCAKDLTNLGHL